jgi:hypothetical protein
MHQMQSRDGKFNGLARRKDFFFEKKKQKTFANRPLHPEPRVNSVPREADKHFV